MTADSLEERFKLAITARDCGDFVEARNILKALVKVRPDSVSILTVLGHMYWKLGEMEQAIDSFRKATSLAPRADVPSRALAHCLWNFKKPDESLAEIRRFLTIADSEGHREMIQELLEMSNLES